MNKRITIFLLMILGSLPLMHCHTAEKDSAGQLKWLNPAYLPADANAKPHNGLAGAVSGMLRNNYMIAGGANFPEAMPWDGGNKHYYSDIYLYEQLPDGTLKYIEKTGNLPVPLAYPAIAQGDDEILVAGGETPEGLTNACFTIQYKAGASQLLLNPLPSLPVPLANASSFLLEKEWFVAGGETNDGTSNKVWKLNIENPANGWQTAPSLPQALSFTTMGAFKNKHGQYEWRIAGGRCRIPNSISKIFSEVYVLRKGDSIWQNGKPLPIAMSAMSSTVLPDGRWIIFSGDKGETFSKVEQLLLEIKKASNDSNKQQLESAKVSLQKSHPGFGSGVWEWQPETEKWTGTDSIPFPAPVTTHAVYSKGNVYIGSGEIRAGIRTPYILHAHLQD